MTARQIASAIVIFIVVIILLSWIVNAADKTIPKEPLQVDGVTFTTDDILQLESLT